VAAVTRIQTMRARLSAVGPVPAFGLVSDPAQRGDVPGHASRLTRNGLSPLVGWRTIPESTPAFTDREGVLLRLRAQLKTEETALVPQVLCGLGGVGKTQLAIQYAWRFREEYDLIWWVNAEQHSQVISGLGDLGELMDLPVPESQQHGARAVLNALSEHTVYARWLMIYDNARSPDLVLPYVPHGAGHVLITSQSQEWLAAGKVIPVDVFTREDSVELLRSFRGDISAQAASEIAARLGDLPLAVEQAGIWLRETGMSPAEYLTEMDGYLLRMVSTLRSLGHPEAVMQTWGLAFDRLAEEDESAAALLRLCAFCFEELTRIKLPSCETGGSDFTSSTRFLPSDNPQ